MFEVFRTCADIAAQLLQLVPQYSQVVREMLGRFSGVSVVIQAGSLAFQSWVYSGFAIGCARLVNSYFTPLKNNSLLYQTGREVNPWRPKVLEFVPEVYGPRVQASPACSKLVGHVKKLSASFPITFPSDWRDRCSEGSMVSRLGTERVRKRLTVVEEEWNFIPLVAQFSSKVLP